MRVLDEFERGRAYTGRPADAYSGVADLPDKLAMHGVPGPARFDFLHLPGAQWFKSLAGRVSFRGSAVPDPAPDAHAAAIARRRPTGTGRL